MAHEVIKCIIRLPPPSPHIPSLCYSFLPFQDGTAIPSRNEEHQMENIRKIVLEQKEIEKKVEARREARLKRLHGCARVNELIFTKDGVYEIDAYRRPVYRSLVRNNRGEITKHKKPLQKKKKKKQFRVEKVCQRLSFHCTVVDSLYSCHPILSCLWHSFPCRREVKVDSKTSLFSILHQMTPSLMFPSPLLPLKLQKRVLPQSQSHFISTFPPPT